MNKFAPFAACFGLLGALVLGGCTAGHYRRAADRAAYGIIKEKSPRVRNMDPHFTIEQTNKLSLAGYPVVTNIPDFLGPDGERERGAHVLRDRKSVV